VSDTEGPIDPGPDRHRKRWSNADLVALVNMRSEGMATSDIAAALGRSVAAIRVVARKLPEPDRSEISAQFMSSEQVCKYLHVKMDWLYDHVSRNEIPHVKLGRLLRFKRREIDAWVEGARRDPA
jgi:excisionase family DNA binding protein